MLQDEIRQVLNEQLGESIENDRNTLVYALMRVANDYFRSQVIDYSEGCDSGKNQFLEWMGLRPMSVEVRLTVDMTIPADVDQYGISRMAYTLLRDNLSDVTIGNVDIEEE